MGIRFIRAKGEIGRGRFTVSSEQEITGTWSADMFDRKLEFDDGVDAPDDIINWVMEKQEKWLNCLACPYMWQNMTFFFNVENVGINFPTAENTISVEVSLRKEGARPRYHASFLNFREVTVIYEQIELGIKWIVAKYQEEVSWPAIEDSLSPNANVDFVLVGNSLTHKLEQEILKIRTLFTEYEKDCKAIVDVASMIATLHSGGHLSDDEADAALKTVVLFPEDVIVLS